VTAADEAFAVEEHAPTPLEALEAQRKARKEKLRVQRDAQRLIDLEALEAAEIEHGDESVAVLEVPYTPGSVTLIIAKRPTDFVLKKFRHIVKAKPGRNGKQEPGDPIEGAEAIAEHCVIYPAGDVLEKLYADRPGVRAQIGAAALNLVVGSKEAEGKE
jgi:hypothetical protein